jgi:integrase
VEFENSLRRDGIRKDGRPGGLSERTILHHHRILSVIFNTAVQWGILKENPVSRVKPPRVPKKKAPSYNEEQTAAMMDALEEEPLKYQAMVHLALATGLRRGEMMGLEWSDLDFEKGTLEVSRASQYLPRKGVFAKDPKNEESKRLIALPEATLRLLKTYKAEWNKQRLKVGDLWQNSDRLFVTWDGRPAHPDTPSSWFPEFLGRHGLPHLNFHGLRHTSASLLIYQGIDIKAVSSRLGHSRTSTTVDIYAHALRRADEAAADIMNSIVANTADKKRDAR